MFLPFSAGEAEEAPATGAAGLRSPGGGGILVNKTARIFKEGGSVVSGGSGASGSRKTSSSAHVVKNVNKLRRIMSVENPPLMPSLQRLRWAGIALLVIAVVLAAVLNYVTASSFQTIQQQLVFSRLASERVVYMSSALTAAQQLVAWGRKWSNISDPLEVRSHVLGNATLFSQATLHMANLVASSTVQWTWTSRYITLTQFLNPPTGVYSPYYQVNQLEASNAFVALMAQFSSPSEVSDATLKLWSSGSAAGEPHVGSMNTDFMRGGNGFESISSSVQTSFSYVLQVIDTISVLQQNVFLGMLCASIAISVFVLLPIVRSLDNAGDEIMLQFISIPSSVRRVLYETALKRIRLLRRTYDDDDEEDQEEEDVSEELEQQNAMAAAAAATGKKLLAGGMGDGASVLDDDATSVNQTQLMQALSSIKEGDSDSAGGGLRVFSRRLSSKSAPRYHKSVLAFWLTFCRYISPLFFLLILFSTVYGTFLAQASTTRQYSSLSIAAGVRSSCSRQALVDLRKLSMLTTDANTIYRNFFFVMGSLDCVREHVRLLVSGNVHPHIASKQYVPYVGVPENAGANTGINTYLTPATAATAYGAMFGNTCTFLADVYARKGTGFNRTQCELFAGGVLTLGLAQAVERWWQDGYTVADRQLKGIFTQGSLLEARGWSLNPDTFNYSTVVCDPKAGCLPYQVVLPMQSGFQAPSYTSDPSYIGDVPPTAFPGDGIWGITNGSGPYWTGTELHTSWMERVEQADALYITPALLALTQLYAAEADTNISSYVQFTGYFIPVFATLFVLVMLLYFLPETIRENKSLQSKRSMLLYLPPPVIQRFPKIRGIIEGIVSADALDFGGAGGSGGGVGSKTRKVAPM